MKNLKNIIVVAMTLVLLSCSKNDEDNELMEIPAQYPMKELMESGAMELKSTKVNNPNHFELGYRFKSFKNGKITALGIRVPNNNVYTVTLWNDDTAEVLVTKDIVSTSGLLSFEDIEPFNIVAGQAYVVSINTNDYYAFNDDGNDIFPVEMGDILLTHYKVKMSAFQSFPSFQSVQSYLGMVDIKFEPDN